MAARRWFSAHDATRSHDCAVLLCAAETDGRGPFCRFHAANPPAWARLTRARPAATTDQERRAAA